MAFSILIKRLKLLYSKRPRFGTENHLQTLNLDQGTEEAAVPGLNRDDVYDREVLVPSLSEQRAIANYLDHETAKIDRLIIVAKNTIKLLQERRTALITAAVTGQIKVTA